ncbi:PC-Esterase [Macleaya cordata]|uniref:PC-Esterase n=1 Tax=Macleaya cordata TaxID=56857 RepID=A0A200QRF6_MACCD|nr:PC-Esterase [Macleaya cordata]
MASSSPPPQPPFPQKKKKNFPYSFSTTLSLSLFLLLLLISIFFFSQRTLEPTLSLYTNNLIISSPDNINLSLSSFSLSKIPPPSPSNPSLSSNPPPLTTTEAETESLVDNGEENSVPIEENISSDLDTKTLDSIPDSGIKMSDEFLMGSEKMNWGNKCDFCFTAPTNPISMAMKLKCYQKGIVNCVETSLLMFNATDFLERLRGKKLMLVGDSMNRNQFESILCLLREGLTDKSKMYEVHGYKITKGRGYYIFKFEDFNCTVDFVRSHFLVKEGIRINPQGKSNPTLSIDKIDKSANRWKRADILVFNTGHWWTHGKTARGKNYYKEGDFIYPQFDAVEAYRRAMRTWGKWIDRNINPAKKLVFYRGYSSAHFRGGDWDSGGTCNGETEPISSGAFLDSYPLKMKIVEEVIREMQVPVLLLNVTKLTNFRKDGHPSVYGKNRTVEKKVSTRRQDCSHWCLPGVPDAWNELIYASLVLQQSTPSTQ